MLGCDTNNTSSPAWGLDMICKLCQKPQCSNLFWFTIEGYAIQYTFFSPVSNVISHMSSLLFHILLLPRFTFPIGALRLHHITTLLSLFLCHSVICESCLSSLLHPPVCPAPLRWPGKTAVCPSVSVNGTSVTICPIRTCLCLLDAICCRHILHHHRDRQDGGEDGEMRENVGNEEREGDMKKGKSENMGKAAENRRHFSFSGGLCDPSI